MLYQSDTITQVNKFNSIINYYTNSGNPIIYEKKTEKIRIGQIYTLMTKLGEEKLSEAEFTELLRLSA